jgi:hypothetical protein
MRRLSSTICAIGVVLGFVVAPSAASASEPTPPLGWGIKAGVSWIAHDPDNLLHMQGNTYTVGVEAEDNPLGRNVVGAISMYRCKPGQLIGGIDPGPGQCAYLGSLTLSGADTTTFTFDRHTGSATLRGSMLATRDDGTAAGSIRVALAWTGVTLASQKSYLFGFSPAEGVEYTILGWRRNWTAVASGTVGRFGAGDASNELVSAGTARYSLKSVKLVG